jgi:hypothetical protein
VIEAIDKGSCWENRRRVRDQSRVGDHICYISDLADPRRLSEWTISVPSTASSRAGGRLMGWARMHSVVIPAHNEEERQPDH